MTSKGAKKTLGKAELSMMTKHYERLLKGKEELEVVTKKLKLFLPNACMNCKNAYNDDAELIKEREDTMQHLFDIAVVIKLKIIFLQDGRCINEYFSSKYEDCLHSTMKGSFDTDASNKDSNMLLSLCSTDGLTASCLAWDKKKVCRGKMIIAL